MEVGNTVEKRDWQEVAELLANEEFINSCAMSEQDPAVVLNVASYSRADKCAHPIKLNRIHPETGECAGVVVACDSNNAYMCAECSEFKRKLRVSQILGTLDRPNVDIAMLTLTAPSFGAVHRATWSAKDEHRNRNLDDAALYRKRLSVQKTRKVCDCRTHHSYDEPLIGTPLGAYDYVGEVLWSQNVPRLMNSTIEALKYRAKTSGIDLKDFRVFAVYERQKRGSLHAHCLIVADNSPAGFQKFVESYDLTKPFPSPSAAFPADSLEGLEVGFQRVEEDAALFASLPVKKRSLEAAMPMVKGVPATVWGGVFDLVVLEADDAASMTEEAAAEELDDVVEFADEEVFKADMPQQKSFKRAAGYVAKYLQKGNGNFSPDGLKDLSAQQRKHFKRFRKTAVLLYTDKFIYEAMLRVNKQEMKALMNSVVARNLHCPENLRAMGEFYLLEDQREKLVAAGVTRSEIGSSFMEELTSRKLTVGGTLDIVKMHAEVLAPLGFGGELWKTPVRYLKMKLNRLADNAGFTGSLVSTHNWLHSLKDLKESRKALYFLMNPDAEAIDYIWELKSQDDEEFLDVSFHRLGEHRREQAYPIWFHQEKVSYAFEKWLRDTDDSSGIKYMQLEATKWAV